MIRSTAISAAWSFCLLLLYGCESPSDTYTLYRDSVVFENGRLHVASFDAADGSKYNNENCQHAQLLFQAQPGVKVRYWCEKGQFKK